MCTNNGRSEKTAEATEAQLASLMVGRDVLFEVEKSATVIGEPVLEVQELRARDKRGLFAVKGVSLSVRRGEILGIAGVEGNGQSELIEAITGLHEAASGTIMLNNQPIQDRSVIERRRMGMAHIPEDRLAVGLNLKGSVSENLIAGKHRQPPYQNRWKRRDTGQIRGYAEQLIQQFDIRAASVDTIVSTLSGGNMQKVVVGREFSMEAHSLIVSQPTRGVDVGAIEAIHQMILAQAASGKAILLVSAELDELYKLSDRILVMYEGEIVGECDPRQVSKEEIGLYMTGAKRGI